MPVPARLEFQGWYEQFLETSVPVSFYTGPQWGGTDTNTTTYNFSLWKVWFCLCNTVLFPLSVSLRINVRTSEVKA